jgi:8-oxo-dGTP diphosphatase
MSKIEVGVHAFVFDDQNRILLIHRLDMDLWDLPGGGLEAGELPTEGAIRETKEETGLDVVVERLGMIGVTNDPLLGFMFYCKVCGGVISTTEESDDVRFFKECELPENLPPRKRAAVETAFQKPPEIIYSHVNLPGGRELLTSLLEEKKK